jgi:REP element-mobilizing transposase RayT
VKKIFCFPAEVETVYCKKVLWNESYFIASGGGVTISVLKKYIESRIRGTQSSTPRTLGAKPPSIMA